MKQVYFSILKGDFIEQVLSLTCSAYAAIQQGKRVLIVDHDQFDVEYLSRALKKYNLTVLEKNTTDFKRVAVFYGKGQHILDITDQAPPLLSVETNLNSLQGDPYPNQEKELFFCYRLNGVEYTETYPERRPSPIVLDLSRATYVHDFFWLNKANVVTYNDILSKIRLKKQSVLEGIHHVIHVLSEDDLKKCADQLKKDPKEFIHVATKKYIDLMDKFITNTNDTILLLQSEDNPSLLEFLEKKGNPYQRLSLDNMESFVNVSSANGLFIGVFNMDKLMGSACSYYLHHTIPYSQSILIDIEHLYKN